MNEELTIQKDVIPSNQTPIVVEGLTKKFGDFTAVDNISFTVEAGRSLAGLAQTEPVRQRPSGCCWV